jgi:hypothetical protein
VLICRNCHTVNEDYGVDPKNLYCGNCGLPTLDRVPFPGSSSSNNNAIVLGTTGAALGAAIGGPVGAIIGGTLGAIFGANSTWLKR